MIELMIPLQNHSHKALYEQIYEYIRNDITDGKISCGERLPSTRLLARHLQVSRSTVEFAYAQLLSEGYIESVPYRGYFASDVSELYQMRMELEQPAFPQEKAEEESCRIDFNPYTVDISHFPYNAWKKCHREVWYTPEEMFLPGEKKGEPKLRQEICNYLHNARGVNCSIHQIIIGAGNEYLLLLLAQILGRQKKVAMENPAFMQAYRIFSNLHYEVEGVEMDENGIRIEQIREKNPDIVYTMPSHQFPVGVVMSMKRRLELLNWAMDAPNRYIIEDDHDSEFRYKGKPIPSLQSIDHGGRVIYMGTFSKSIASAVRVGYMVLPQELLKVYEETCGFYATTVPRFQQEVLYHFLKEGAFERNLNRMRTIYKTKHDALTTALKKEPWVHRVYGDHAGMHVLVEVDTSLSEEELLKRVRAHSVRIYGLREYLIDPAQYGNHPTILLGYGNLSEEEMREGLQVIREVCQKETENQKNRRTC